MSYLDKYVVSSNADLRAEAVLNTLQKKILKQAKPTEQDLAKQDFKKLKNKAYSDELKAETSMDALQKKQLTRAKTENPAFNTYQKLADKDRADLAFEIQLKTISDNATKKPSDYKAVPLSTVTQAMIEDFQAEQMQPIEIEGQYFKYHPAGVENVVLDVPVLEAEMSNDQSIALKERIYEAGLDIETHKLEISKLSKALEVERGKYDSEVAKNDAIADATKKKGANKTAGDAFAKVRNLILADTQRHRNDILRLETEIEAIELALVENDERSKRNRQEEYNVNQANKDKLDNLTSLLTSLNQSKNLVIQKEMGEDDADYLKRLQDIGATTYSTEEVRDLANIKNLGQTKQNLKSFFTDNGRITTIAKMLTPDQKFLFNKLFLKIKKNYLDVYGFDNKLVSNEDVVDFINAISSQPAQGTTVEQIFKNIAEEESKKKSSGVSPEVVGVPIPKGGDPYADLPELGEPLVPEASAEPNVTTAEASKVVASVELKKYARDNSVDIRGLTSNYDVMEKINKANLEIPDYIISMFAKEQNKAEALAFNSNLSKKQVKGKGIKAKSKPVIQGIGVREVPQLMKLGKIYITADQLYYNNLLGVRNKNNRQVTGVPNKLVSDTLVHLIFKILDGNNLNKSDLFVLTPPERVIYDKLMKLSGLHKSMVNSVDETLSEMKKRLELISGEIEAGNNNKELLKEAHGILFSMAQMNVITHTSASEYYKGLKSYF